MKRWVKILLWGTGIAATGGTVYAFRLSRFAKKAEVISKVNVHKIALDGITLRVDSLVKNPTGLTVNMKFPFVKLLYKDATIGTSVAVNKDVRIPKNSQVQLEPMMIQIPILGLFSLGADLLKAFTDGTAIKLTVKYSSTVLFGKLNAIPFAASYEVTVKK
jgi:hypothetical protein